MPAAAPAPCIVFCDPSLEKVNVRNRHRETPLLLAVRANNAEAVVGLLGFGARLDEPDVNGKAVFARPSLPGWYHVSFKRCSLKHTFCRCSCSYSHVIPVRFYASCGRFGRVQFIPRPPVDKFFFKRWCVQLARPSGCWHCCTPMHRGYASGTGRNEWASGNLDDHGQQQPGVEEQVHPGRTRRDNSQIY